MVRMEPQRSAVPTSWRMAPPFAVVFCVGLPQKRRGQGEETLPAPRRAACYALRMELSRRTLVTEEEFLALPESLDKVELIDGEVYVAPSPSYRHQWIQGELLFALQRWAREQEKPYTIGHAPSDIRFAKNRILQPDIYVIRGKVPLDVESPLDLIPFLCVEVLSKDRRHDRVTKRFVYAAAGVEEYWVVEQMGLVERWTGDELDVAEEITGTLTSPRLPGFSFDVARLREEAAGRAKG